jgi:hypothetical protein
VFDGYNLKKTRLEIVIMKKHLTALLAMAGIAFVAQDVSAQTTYTGRDLILGLRTTGGANDLEVNVGQASLYYGASSSFLVPGVTAADINATFGNFNNVLWSVGGAVRTGDGGDTAIPVSTLWVTRARTDVNSQSTPWIRQSSGALAPSATKIASVGANYGGQTPTANSPTAAVIPDGSAQSYHTFVGTGNYGGSFQGNVENLTPASFSSGSSVSDLYEIRPGSGASTYLGYFSFAGGTDQLTFVPVPEASTYGLIAGAGLLILSLRHQFRRNQA